MGGECLAAALYLFVTGLSRRKNPEVSRLRVRTVLALAASIVLSVAGVLWAYGRAATVEFWVRMQNKSMSKSPRVLRRATRRAARIISSSSPPFTTRPFLGMVRGQESRSISSSSDRRCFCWDTGMLQR